LGTVAEITIYDSVDFSLFMSVASLRKSSGFYGTLRWFIGTAASHYCFHSCDCRKADTYRKTALNMTPLSMLDEESVSVRDVYRGVCLCSSTVQSVSIAISPLYIAWTKDYTRTLNMLGKTRFKERTKLNSFYLREGIK